MAAPLKGGMSRTGESFKLVPWGAALAVVEVPPDERQCSSGEILTREQLEELLRRHSIPMVTAPALSGYINSLHHLPGFESHAPGPFSQNPGMTPLSRSGWRGRLGEVSAQYGGFMPQQDLNAVRYNHPIFDLRSRLGGLSSVKTSVRSEDGGEAFATYLRGLRDVVGLRPAAYARARAALYPNLTPAAGEALLLRNGYISVNADDVKPLQDALRDASNYRKQAYREIADRFLEHEPVRLNGTVYRTYEALDDARRSTGSPGVVRQRAENALRALREKIASRVLSNGLTMQHLIHLERFRQQVAAANPRMPPAEIARWVFPELLMVARHGGGVRGHAVSAGIAGGRGAAGGAVVTLILEIAHIVHASPPNKGQRVTRAVITGGTSGLVGGATQNLATSNAGSALSRKLIGQGMNTRLATGTGRAMGSFAGGALAAPVFTMASLALDDEEHSRTDYVATGTRAFISGGLSSAVAAGVVGALWGSEVPLLGNAVGFIVGFAGYYVMDALTGEQVEQGARRAMDGPSGGGR
ncbi:MAG TPA: hypothetical protein VE057_16340 [Archangium sp.]|nr:hypothetical protein [Archangium sp.]